MKISVVKKILRRRETGRKWLCHIYIQHSYNSRKIIWFKMWANGLTHTSKTKWPISTLKMPNIKATQNKSTTRHHCASVSAVVWIWGVITGLCVNSYLAGVALLEALEWGPLENLMAVRPLEFMGFLPFSLLFKLSDHELSGFAPLCSPTAVHHRPRTIEWTNHKLKLPNCESEYISPLSRWVFENILSQYGKMINVTMAVKI